MSRRFQILAGCFAALVTAATAHAAPIVPTYTTFGTLSGATFGGSGIPNTAVAITTIDLGGGDSITLGLTATARFANPPVTNNGAGVFTATLGPDAPPTLARWNFDFYTNATTTGSYFYDLLYDFDPGLGTDDANLGKVTYSGNYEDSWNLGFGFLDIPAGPVTPPLFPSFSPTAAGQYSFALIARDGGGAELGRSAINVNAVPEPASLLLLGTGLLGLIARRRSAV